MRTAFWLVGIGALVVATVLGAQDRAELSRAVTARAGTGPALDEIGPDGMAAHLKFLADDLLEGRAPSTRGGQLAAGYLATQLALLGFEPAGEGGSYFQDVSIVESVVNPAFTLAAGAGTPFRYLEDVVAFSDVQEERVDVSGEVVFVGHGIVAPEYDWNDYAGVDMRGKIALVMVNDPPATTQEPQLFGGRALTYYGRWTYKFEEAARQGAAGAILIHTDESATYPWQVVQSSWSGTQYSIPSPPGAPRLRLKSWVTEGAARQIAARAKQDLDALRDASRNRGAKPVPFGVDARATIMQAVRQTTSPNVIGVLRGMGGSQGVIYTAHYDHLGMRQPQAGDQPGTDRLFNGAIDNASGLAGVLEIAQSFARASRRPARSVYVLFTTAEESGLLGAEYFAGRPVVPVSALAANINIDSLNMGGPSRDIVLLGAERSTLGDVASQLAAESGRVVGPDPEPERGYFFRSDHFPLAKVGVPAVSLSDPVEYIGSRAAEARRIKEEYDAKRYHQPDDEILPSWDYAGAVNDMRFLAELGWRIANAPDMPVYHSDEQFARPRLNSSN